MGKIHSDAKERDGRIAYSSRPASHLGRVAACRGVWWGRSITGGEGGGGEVGGGGRRPRRMWDRDGEEEGQGRARRMQKGRTKEAKDGVMKDM